LRIASVTPVYGYGEETDLTYALISRGFLIPPVDREDDRYLELRLPKAGASLSELLFAAEAFGAQVYRIHSLRLSQQGAARDLYSLVFRTEGRDFSGLLSVAGSPSRSCPCNTAQSLHLYVGVYSQKPRKFAEGAVKIPHGLDRTGKIGYNEDIK
jgi:hypothetical protein